MRNRKIKFGWKFDINIFYFEYGTTNQLSKYRQIIMMKLVQICKYALDDDFYFRWKIIYWLDIKLDLH